MTDDSEANCWEALLAALFSPASDVAAGAEEPPDNWEDILCNALEAALNAEPRLET